MNRPKKNPAKDRAVIGIHAVKEALRVSQVSSLWLRKEWKDSQDLRDLEELARSKRVRIEERAVGQLNQIAESHQGVVANVSSRPTWDWDDIENQKIVRVVVLDQVEDPHNLGAVLRTAWLLGVKAVFIPETRSVALSPAASKVAQGASEHIPLVETNLAQELEEAKKRGFWVFGLSHRASKPIYSLQLPEKVVWVLGSEGAGIRKPIERACDELISIPQMQSDASFNVSVAAALALGETFRQHQILETPGK